LIGGMPRPRPPFLHKDTSRHGKTRWYVRPHIGNGERGARIRLPDEYGTPAFWDAYNSALRGEPPKKERAKPAAGTLKWLIERYRASGSWRELAPLTRKQRENIFLHVCKTAGEVVAAKIEKTHIIAGRDRRAETPAAANNYLKTMRALFAWAVENDLLAFDPTRDVKRLKVKSEGFYTWTEEDVQAFELRYPIGTRERLALAILLYTGLRRGDACQLGRQHIRNGVILMRTEKTGVQVAIPVRPELKAVLEASKTGDLAFIVTRTGEPMSKFGFGNWFGAAARAAGVPGNAHGLRKAGATRLANHGATERQLNAIYGWADGSRESARYTQKADRERLARDGMAKFGENETRISMDAPVSQVRTGDWKTKQNQ
jgi:integrase